MKVVTRWHEGCYQASCNKNCFFVGSKNFYRCHQIHLSLMFCFVLKIPGMCRSREMPSQKSLHIGRWRQPVVLTKSPPMSSLWNLSLICHSSSTLTVENPCRTWSTPCLVLHTPRPACISFSERSLSPWVWWLFIIPGWQPSLLQDQTSWCLRFKCYRPGYLLRWQYPCNWVGQWSGKPLPKTQLPSLSYLFSLPYMRPLTEVFYEWSFRPSITVFHEWLFNWYMLVWS